MVVPLHRTVPFVAPQAPLCAAQRILFRRANIAGPAPRGHLEPFGRHADALSQIDVDNYEEGGGMQPESFWCVLTRWCNCLHSHSYSSMLSHPGLQGELRRAASAAADEGGRARIGRAAAVDEGVSDRTFRVGRREGRAEEGEGHSPQSTCQMRTGCFGIWPFSPRFHSGSASQESRGDREVYSAYESVLPHHQTNLSTFFTLEEELGVYAVTILPQSMAWDVPVPPSILCGGRSQRADKQTRSSKPHPYPNVAHPWMTHMLENNLWLGSGRTRSQVCVLARVAHPPP